MDNKKKRVIFYSSIILGLIIVSLIGFSVYHFFWAEGRVKITVWDGSVATSFNDGDGTKENPYIIENGSELAFLFSKLNSDDYLSYYNKYYELSSNLDMNGLEFSYLNTDNPFNGYINGNGYAIYNFKMSKYYTRDNNYIFSLFNKMENGKISYLNIEDVTIDVKFDEDKASSEAAEESSNEDGTTDNEEVTEEAKANVYVSMLGIDSKNMIINNISFNNIKIDGDDRDVISSMLFINDNGENDISNINLDVASKYDTRGLIYNYKDSNVKNIFYSNKDLVLIKDKDIENCYYYDKSDNDIKFNEIDNDGVLEILNNDDTLQWVIDDGKLFIQNIMDLAYENKVSVQSLDEDISDDFIEMPFAMVKSAAMPFALNDDGDEEITDSTSGIRNNVLYINDLEQDYNYYKSLNYTEILDGNKLPGEASTGYYDDNYLVKVQITYDGKDFNNNSLVGAVSPTESVNKYVYYKYYPLERNSSGNLATDSNGKNYIKIALIDNPFSKRPTDKGFNGWATLDSRVTLTYDYKIYTRYAYVSVGSSRSVILDFNAIWSDANIRTGGTNQITNLDNGGMKSTYRAVNYTVTENVDVNCNPYFKTAVDVIPATSNGNASNKGTIPANTYYFKGSNNSNASATTNLTYVTRDTSCSTTGGQRCIYYRPTHYNVGDTFNETAEYHFVYLNSGSNYRYTTDSTNYKAYNTCQEERQVQRTRYESGIPNNGKTNGYFYSVGTSYDTTSDLYYDSLGRSCGASGNSCSNGAYKLIQNNESLTNSDGTSISVAHYSSDNSLIDYNKYYYLVTRDMNILVNTSSGTNLSNYMSSKPYTLTSTYNGGDITNDYITVSSANLSADMVIENIKIDGVGGSTASTSSLQNNSLGANSHNLKIGRNVFYSDTDGVVNDNNKIFNGIYGLGSNYSGSSTSPDRFKIMVESGNYNYLLSGTAETCTTVNCSETINTYYVNSDFIYGSDYDKASNDNSKLKVYFNALSTVRDNFNSSSSNKALYSSKMIVKSGRYGKTNGNAYSTDNAYGIYAGGRSNTHYANALRILKLEGGDVNVINGGPCVEDNLTSDSAAIYMTGGTVREIYGGAGTTTTYGNRLVSVSGGKVLYSIFGGSNAYNSGTQGLLTGSTLVYVGGNAVIGDDDLVSAGTKLFNVTSGNVFGAGNGADGGTTAGIVNSSHVIINGGVIKNSVYAGGNHGSVGTRISSDTGSKAVVDILGGTIDNSVFGAGESIGGGYTSASVSEVRNLTKEYYTNVNEVTTADVATTVTVVNAYGGTVSGPTTTHSNITGNIPSGVYLPDGNITSSSSVCGSNTPGNREDIKTDTSTEQLNCKGIYKQNVDTIPLTYSGRTANNSRLPAGVYYTNNNSNNLGDTTNLLLSGNNTTCSVSGWGISTRYCYYFTPTTRYSGNEETTDSVRYVYLYSGNNYRTTTSSADYINKLCDTKTTTVVTTGTICSYAGNKTSVGDVYNSSTKYYEIDEDKFKLVTPTFDIVKSNSYNHSVIINLNGGEVKQSIYGGSNSAGVLYGNVYINLYKGMAAGAYGGGRGVSGDSEAVQVLGNTKVNSKNDDNTLLQVSNVYGGSAFGRVNEHGATEVVIDGGTFGSVYGGGEGDSATDPETYGNIDVTIKSGIITNVFGGNNLAGIPSEKVRVYLEGGTVANAFGGGNSSSVNVTNIYLQDNANVGSLFGGSNSTGDVEESHVYLEDGHANYVYGGNNVGGTTKITNINASGGTTTEIYGGGKNAVSDTTNVLLNGTTATNVFGGGERAAVNDSTNIDFKNGTYTAIYGGSNYSGEVKLTNINATGGTSTYVYGGGKVASTVKTNVTMNGSTVTNVFGGGESANISDSTNVNIVSGNVPYVYGGSNTSGDVDVTNINYNNGTSLEVYGGNNAGGKVTTSNVNMNNGTVTDLYGGGKQAGVITTNVNLNGGIVTNSYGGSNVQGDVTSSNIRTNEEDIKVTTSVTSELVNPYWQDTNYTTVNNITVTVLNRRDVDLEEWQVELLFPETTVIYSNDSNSNIVINNNRAVVDNVHRYWGNNTINPGDTYSFTFKVYSTTSIDDFYVNASNITPNSGNSSGVSINVTNVYGGNNQGGVTGTTNIDLFKGNFGNIYGGGNEADCGYTNVNVDGLKINSIYGGGNLAEVTNDVVLNVSDTTVKENIYGGGNKADVLGNVTTTVSGNVNVAKSIFAGGNAGAVGVDGLDSSVAKLVITGANVNGNVYGGCNTSVVYGRTLVNIGYSADNPSDLKMGDINILGTVFGGGEANAEGSEIFDYNFISVTRAINININGLHYRDSNYAFSLNGSIFGSGNASRSSGTSNIYIAHLGTLPNPSRNISIQRTDEVIIDDSVLELKGTTDRTNEYSNIKYSLSRIDKLILKNSSSLLLQENANLLKYFKSAVDINGQEEVARVDIDTDAHTIDMNVNNRVYMKAGQKLNVTTTEDATSYGKVEGMSFLGMYTPYANGSISYGMYDVSLTDGSEADAADVIIGGSYVLGLHADNHDITKDGFYTNYIDDDYTVLSTDYIVPTPENATHYMWTIGAASINYTVELTASKYSSLGTYSLSLIDFAQGNTEFDVIGFNSEGLTNGVDLVDSNSVPRFATNGVSASNILGISLKSETTEWTGYGNTKLLSTNNGTATGTKVYKTDNVSMAPTFMFYLYHPKNISENKDLGTVVLSLQAKVPKNEIEYDVKLIMININLGSRIFDDDDAYDASITYNSKYDFPSATDVKITNRSQFTAYYALYTNITDDNRNFYGINGDYHRSLVSDFVLPVGTSITMLDMASDNDNPNYYYYNVSQNDYNQALSEYNTYGEVAYDLSRFVRMDSTSNNNNYNDTVENQNYFRDNGDSVFEEFIFIFNFKNTTLTGEYLDKSMLFELRNNEDRTIISVLGIRQNLMKYSLYDSGNAVLGQETSTDNEYLHYNEDKVFDMDISVLYDETDNKVKIIDSNYESSSMGLNIILRDASNNQVSSQMLSGTYISIDNVRYHTDSNGVFRIKLADKISNITKKLILNSSETLPAGRYTMEVTLFASQDGLHNSGNLGSDIKTFDINVINNNNLIKVTLQDEMKLVDGTTGLNELGNNNLVFNVRYKSNLTDPNLRLSVYKRKIDTSRDIEYEEADVRQLTTNSFVFPSIFGYRGNSGVEFFLKKNPGLDNTFSYNLRPTLISGTYKFVFKLYDGDFLVEQDNEYVIVQK